MTEEEPPPLVLLSRLMDARRVSIGVHVRKMNSPGSPVYNTLENVWPAALVLLSSLAATSLIHLWLGIAVLAVGCWWWLARMQPKVKAGVFDRTVAWSMQSEAHFDGLWAKGVLSLLAELPDGGKIAATRRDDWRAFIRRVARETDMTQETA